MDLGLLDQARAQGGVLTTGQAGWHGVTPRGLTRLVNAGELVRVRKGAFVLAGAWTAAKPVERLALRTRAVMAGRAGAVAAGECAVALHGLPLWGVPLERVLLHGDVTRTRSRSGLTVIPQLSTVGAVSSETGVLAVTSAYAVVQLCTAHGHRAALIALDAALHSRRVVLSEVVRAAACLSLSGSDLWEVEQMVRLADPSCESVGESRTRLLLHDLGYAARSQVALSDAHGFVARVDFLVEDRVVVEFDGLMKYDGFEGRAALAAEKRREDRLRSMGFVVVRLVWSDLEHPERVAALMNRAVAQIRRTGAERSAS
ncbi:MULTISPECIES: type IV toxin-antitoxin system AbiEi family antitoxin domain-containing protein [unclassified Knoellia]|uniref:type IV toxin-antitoxin system AbiEi family antitoxin domain-containing protein n=1 Tax=Knoellia altitudinis TaxID=3404795 RepID=UPI0036133C5B